MKKGLMLLANGFEQVEALATLDVLKRTGEVEIVLASIHDHSGVTSSSGVTVIANTLLNDINDYSSYDFIVLPGGKLGVDNLNHSDKVKAALKYFYSNNKLVCAICAAPSILGELGYLDDKKYTCFPGFQKGKGDYVNTGSIIDGNIITGHSMGYSIEFGENIIRKLLGEEYVTRIQGGVKGL